MATPRVALGAVVFGSMAGLGFALVVFLVLGIVGLVGLDHGAALLIVIQLSALVIAGFVGARFGGPPTVIHGSLSALLLSLVTGSLSVAANDAGWASIVVLGVVAAVLGSAGGALAIRPSRRH